MSDQEPLQDDIPLADQVHLHDPYILTLRPLPEDVAKKIAKAISTIRVMYDEGVPLYTKETLSNVSQQIEDVKNGRSKIYVKGLDGGTVEFNIETGLVIGLTSKPDLEYVLTAPQIEFRSYREMVSTKYNFNPCMAYSVIRISHYVEWRNRITKEVLKPSLPNSLIDTWHNFLKTQQLWKESAPYKQLESILERRIPPRTDAVVAFALGSISRPNRNNQASMFQYALTLSVRDIVEMSNGSQKVRCISQDPIYNTVDKSVLSESGITVLKNPQAFLEISNSSVVVSCSPDIPVKQIVADLARPAVMIWNPVSGKTRDPELMWTDEDSPRVLQMVRNFYEEFSFHGNAELFGDLAVYVRIPDKDQCGSQTGTRDDL